MTEISQWYHDHPIKVEELKRKRDDEISKQEGRK